jgi:hypothetical protein
LGDFVGEVAFYGFWLAFRFFFIGTPVLGLRFSYIFGLKSLKKPSFTGLTLRVSSGLSNFDLLLYCSTMIEELIMLGTGDYCFLLTMSMISLFLGFFDCFLELCS